MEKRCSLPSLLDRPLAEAKALVEAPDAFIQAITRIMQDKQNHPVIAQMIRPGVSDDPPPTERTASSSGGYSHEVALNMVGRLEWQGSKLIRIPFRISKLSFLKWTLVTRHYTMTKPALISVKASLTKMTLLLATSCGASAVTPLSAETVRDSAVGEECPLFSSSRSVGWGLGGSDPPKSTSESP